jgi:hypothetical protein
MKGVISMKEREDNQKPEETPCNEKSDNAESVEEKKYLFEELYDFIEDPDEFE